MADRNVSLYLKMNEVINQTNEHTAYFRMVDALLNEMNTQPGIWGWLTRLCFAHFFSTRMRMAPHVLQFIDIPPVIPGTKEIDTDAENGRIDSGGGHNPRAALTKAPNRPVRNAAR